MTKVINIFLMLLVISTTAQVKADQLTAMIDMSVKQMKSDPDFKGFTACLEVSESKFLQAFRKTMRYCMDKHAFAEFPENAMNACFDSQTEQRLGISGSRYKRCGEEYPGDEASSEAADVDYSNMSEEELEQQMLVEQQRAKELLGSIVAMSEAASKGTEGQITLPIYSPSKIVTHIMDDEDNPKAIPVALFHSNDSLSKIAAFYDNHLNGYDKKTYDEGMVIYMMNMEKDFEPLADIELYQQLPHVAIYQFADDNGKQKTSIEIAYIK